MTTFFRLTLLSFALFTSAVAAPKWLKLTTEDAVIYSDASDRRMVDFATQYAAFRRAFRDLVRPYHSPTPATVLIFKTDNELDNDAGYHVYGRHLSSTTRRVNGRLLIAMSGESDLDQALKDSVMLDTISELAECGYVLPTWMAQGTGAVLASVRPKSSSINVGDGPYDYVRSWRPRDALKWDHFFTITLQSPEYSGSAADGRFQGQAWALMHWVLLSKDGAMRFNQIAANLRNGSGLKAVAAAMNTPPEKWTAEIEDHFDGPNAVLKIPFDRDAFRNSLVPAPAPEAEVHLQRAYLLFASNQGDEADGELQKAKTLTPDSVEVKEAEAWAALRDHDPDRAAILYRAAIAAGSKNPDAYLISAKQRMNDMESRGRDEAGGGGTFAGTAIEELRKAIALNPGARDAYGLLGRAFFLSPQIGPENLKELEPGLTPDSAGAAVRYYYALLDQRLGRQQEYIAELRRALNDAEQRSSLYQMIAERLAKADIEGLMRTVQSAVKGKDYAAAHEAVARATNSDAGGAHVATYRALDAWISQSERLEKLQELRSAGKTAEFATAAKSFLADYPNSPVAAQIKRMLDEAGGTSSGATQ